MTSKLSDNDFQRLQENLIELKSLNYTLEEQARKYKHGLGEASTRAKVFEEENNRLNRLVEKSKKALEVQHLAKENAFLQEKLNFQEEQHRHQNQTLMHELNDLVNKNEHLELQLKDINDIKDIKPSGPGDQTESSRSAILKLESELKDLELKLDRSQKKVEDLQLTQHADKSDKDRDRLVELEKEVERLEDVEFKLESTRSEARLLEAHNLELKTSMANLNKQQQDTQSALSVAEEKLVKKQETILLIQNEKEEIIGKHTAEVAAITTSKENELMLVSEHKDRLQLQLNQAHETLSEVREASNIVVADHLATIQDLKDQLAQYPPEKFKELEASKICVYNQLQSVTDTASHALEKATALQSDLENAHGQIEELHRQNEANNQSLSSLEAEVESSRATCDSRKSLIDEMALSLQMKTDQLRALELETTAKIDELNKKNEEASTTLQQSLESTCKELNAKNAILEEEKREKASLQKDLNEAVDTIQTSSETAKEELASKEQDKAKLLKRISQLEENHNNELRIWDEKLKEKVSNQEMELAALRLESTNSKEAELNHLRTEISLAGMERSELEEKMERLEQDHRDALEDKKIVEKKGQGLLKDVKRQLVNEKRRNEKLQEKMKECFIDTESTHSDPARDAEYDRSSISSWSLMSGNNERERSSTPSQMSPDIPISVSDPAIHQNSPIAKQITVRPRGEDKRGVQDVEKGVQDGSEGGHGAALETDLLLERIAAIQQEKWGLEERLNMVEQSGAAMAEEIFRKNTLIGFYCMEAGREGRRVGQPAQNHPDRGRMKTLMERLVHTDNIHDNKEVQRMQQMLEETLTKNMVLQQNMDSLSQEVVRLSKLVPTGE